MWPVGLAPPARLRAHGGRRLTSASMATKRQPSKQRRQTQNQRQRAALEARRANAAGGGVPDGKVHSGGSRRSGGGGLLSRLRGAQSSGQARRAGAGGAPPGYRAAMSGLLAGVAAAIVGALLISIPVTGDGEPVANAGAMAGEWTLSALEVVQEDPEATPEEVVAAVDDWTPNGEQPYGQAYFPLSLGLALPIVGAGLAFRAVARRSPAKVVNRTMYITLFGTLLNAQLLFLFLPTVIGIGIAAFQVRKAEVAAAAAAQAGAGDGDGDDVIDVEEAIEVEEAIDQEEAVEGDQLIEAEAEADALPETEPDQRRV
jgi:hypothetical protein